MVTGFEGPVDGLVLPDADDRHAAAPANQGRRAGDCDLQPRRLPGRAAAAVQHRGDADDRHVLAAAIRAGAQAIVIFNLDDFPADRLGSYNIDAKHPGDFVIDTIDLSPGAVAKVIADQAGALRNPPRSIPELPDTLRDQGLVRSVAKLRELFGSRDP
jgi:hypothetical protein